MIVLEVKLKGTDDQYGRLDEAIRTSQVVRNSCIRYWIDNQGVGKGDLSKLCAQLAKEFEWAGKLNSMARQASAERAWQSIARFYANCRARVEYFAKLHKVAVVAVPPSYTSQDCFGCGNRVKKTLSTRTHQCSKCGQKMHRDHNAAQNILVKGLEVLGVRTSTGGQPGTNDWGAGMPVRVL